MKILAIRFARLGDIILLLPALSALKASFPESHLTFLTGHRCAPIGEMCPFLDDVMSVNRIAMRDGPVLAALRDMKHLIGNLRDRQFDLAIDFHSFRETNLLTWLSGAGKRLGMKRFEAAYLPFCFNMPPVPEDKRIHVRDMFLRVVRSVGSGSPAQLTLALPPDARRWSAGAVTSKPYVCFYVDSSGEDKSWPAERFAQVADFAVRELNAVAVILSGRDGTTAERVKQASADPSRFDVLPGLDLRRMAAIIADARLLVSNDSGPMHFGPALGVPTLGLFSVGLPAHFRPTGPRDAVIQENLIGRISVDAVIDAVRRMWTSTVDPGLQR